MMKISFTSRFVYPNSLVGVEHLLQKLVEFVDKDESSCREESVDGRFLLHIKLHFLPKVPEDFSDLDFWVSAHLCAFCLAKTTPDCKKYRCGCYFEDRFYKWN